MEFRKWKRTAEILPMRMWRLASVDEVRNNMEIIKNEKILDSWDTVRLLDGWVAGPGYRYPIGKEYRSNMGHMLLVKTPEKRPYDGSFSEKMFSEVTLNSEGRKSALLLSCDDKITEVMCFVVKNIIDSFQGHGERQAELDRLTESLMKTFSHGRTVFHFAADQPNNEKHAVYLAELIPQNFEYGIEMIKAVDKYRRTALHYAAFHGHIKLCAFLMNNCKLKAEDEDRNGENLLHFIVKRGKAHIVYIMLESNAVRNLFALDDVNHRTLLHKAARIGNADTMASLLEKISLLDQRDILLKERASLLDLRDSLLEERIFLLNVLLDNVLDKRVSHLDSVVHILQEKMKDNLLKEKQIVETLLREKEILVNLLKQIVKEQEERVKKSIRQADIFGQTALLEAARGGHFEAVQYLLDMGSSPLFDRNSEGKTALHYAVQIPDEQRAIQMAQTLLEHCKSEEERLLLLWASATGMGTAEQSAESSLQVQAYLKQQREAATRSSSSLLRSAIKHGYVALAWELINRGADTSQLRLPGSDLAIDQRDRVQDFLGALQREEERVKKMQESGRDQPTIYDSLGRRAFAEGLAALFLNPNVKSPVTVGISGEWGMGKSSLMLQTEAILLQARAQLAFPIILPFQDFPGSTQFEPTDKGLVKYNEIKNGVRDLLQATGRSVNSYDDPLVYFLDEYQDKYPQVYKSLALMDRGEMFSSKDIKTSDSSSNLGKVPSILTVRYNAWHYQNELEAWAGLAVTLTKAMEDTMTRSQRIRSRWTYAWKERRGDIILQFLLPCLLALFLSGWATWAVWLFLRRSKHTDVMDLIYGSIPVTLVVILLTAATQMHSVLKDVSSQIMEYIRLPDHSTNLGYQHQVISDINFLKKETCEKPSWLWKLLAGNWLWRMRGLHLDTVEGTSIPKIPLPSKDDIRIIVFVDDLDRCEDSVILQVLSAINLVLAACEINVILGMDKKMIARAIAHKYQPEDSDKSNMVDVEDLAEKYLSKIVQLPLALPDFDNAARQGFLKQLLKEEFKEGGDDESDESSQSSSVVEPNDADNPPQNSRISQPSSGVHLVVIENPMQSPSDLQGIADVQLNDSGNPRQNSWSSQSSRGDLAQSSLKSWLIFSHLGSCFRVMTRWFCGCCSGPDVSSSKIKSMAVNIQLILPSYSKEEQNVMSFLSEEATHGLQIPREWKRFLTYHRLVWNILFRMKQTNLPGWRGQLLVWIFCCWQWKDNINLIIKNWKELMRTVNEDDPTLKIIIEHHCDKLGKIDLEKDKWKLLLEALDRYDVSMDSIQSFQKFRLHCDIGYLPRPSEIATEPMSNFYSYDTPVLT